MRGVARDSSRDANISKTSPILGTGRAVVQHWLAAIQTSQLQESLCLSQKGKEVACVCHRRAKKLP